jgi:very-short-patch-repair endonuclease
MSNSVYQLYDFVNSGGTIYKSSQSNGGIYKVPFAIDAKGEEVSQEKAKKYYLACRAIDDKLKLLKNKKRIYSTFFGQIFYFVDIKERLNSILATLESIFFIYVSVFLDWPQPYFCPDCHGEVLFADSVISYGLKRRSSNSMGLFSSDDTIPAHALERTYFSHKVICCPVNEGTIEILKNKYSCLSDQYKWEALKTFINTNYLKEDFHEHLRNLKYSIGTSDHSVKLQEDDIEKIISHIPKLTSRPCDFMNETEKHLRARWSVVKSINENKEIFLLRRCSKCKKTGRQFFPVKQRKAFLDYILPSDQRADVAITDESNNLIAVIEIVDEKIVSKEKEKALEGIPWGEISAETILGSFEWLVKKDNFNPYVCKACKNAQSEDMFPHIIQSSEPSTEGRVRFESENYFFYLNLLLKEEFRIPIKMTELVVDELNKFFYFKVTEILVFNKDGSPDIIYRVPSDIKLPPDEDIMWVLSFISHDNWINILRHTEQKPYYTDEKHAYYHPYGFATPQKYSRDAWNNKYPIDKEDSSAKLLALLNRFFLLPKGQVITNIKYWDYKYQQGASKKYRKKKGSSKYSIPHENAYGSDIEAKLGEALIKENINFKKQYEIYTDGTLLTVTDFYIESGKIALYCDGFKYHYNKESVIKDRNQDRVLQFLGYKVLRYTGSEIVGNLDKCVREIKGFINKFTSMNCI